MIIINFSYLAEVTQLDLVALISLALFKYFIRIKEKKTDVHAEWFFNILCVMFTSGNLTEICKILWNIYQITKLLSSSLFHYNLIFMFTKTVYISITSYFHICSITIVLS